MIGHQKSRERTQTRRIVAPIHPEGLDDRDFRSKRHRVSSVSNAKQWNHHVIIKAPTRRLPMFSATSRILLTDAPYDKT